MKRCSTWLVGRETETETTKRYNGTVHTYEEHYNTSINWQSGLPAGTTAARLTCGLAGMQNENPLWEHALTTWPSNPTARYLPEGNEKCSHKNPCVPADSIFIRNHKTKSQQLGLSTGQWIKKYVQWMDNGVPLGDKEEQTAIHITTWVNHKHIKGKKRDSKGYMKRYPATIVIREM